MNDDGIIPLAPETCRAARGLLDLSQEQLARRAGVSRLTVADFERGVRRPIPATLTALRRTLEAAGIEFPPGGVALRARLGEARLSAAGDQRLAGVLHVLQAHAGRLRQLGLRHLSLFGSTARGEAGSDSDVDLLVELDRRRRLDVFDYAAIAGELQKLLPMPVDIARRDRLKRHVAEAALRDEIRVF